jgi:hypothetical protein
MNKRLAWGLLLLLPWMVYADEQIFQWKQVTGKQWPAAAFVAAENQENPLYVCQAHFTLNNAGGVSVVVPGVVDSGGCVITYAGQAYLEPDYAVLTSQAPGYWTTGQQVKNNPSSPLVYPVAFASTNRDIVISQPTPHTAPPLYNALAVVGGQDSSGDTYVCRVLIHGQYFVGKASSNTCFIAVGTGEASWPDYEVLLSRHPEGD